MPRLKQVMPNLAYSNAVSYPDWVKEQYNETKSIILPDSASIMSSYLMVGTLLQDVKTKNQELPGGNGTRKLYHDPDLEHTLQTGTTILFSQYASAPTDDQVMGQPGGYVTFVDGIIATLDDDLNQSRCPGCCGHALPDANVAAV